MGNREDCSTNPACFFKAHLRYVLPTLLGDRIDIAHWVGCDGTSLLQSSVGLHTVELRMEGKEIHVLVRLFAEFGAPEYHVVVGHLR